MKRAGEKRSDADFLRNIIIPPPDNARLKRIADRLDKLDVEQRRSRIARMAGNIAGGLATGRLGVGEAFDTHSERVATAAVRIALLIDDKVRKAVTE